jgi:hypothetical protein
MMLSARVERDRNRGRIRALIAFDPPRVIVVELLKPDAIIVNRVRLLYFSPDVIHIDNGRTNGIINITRARVWQPENNIDGESLAADALDRDLRQWDLASNAADHLQNSTDLLWRIQHGPVILRRFSDCHGSFETQLKPIELHAHRLDAQFVRREVALTVEALAERPRGCHFGGAKNKNSKMLEIARKKAVND